MTTFVPLREWSARTGALLKRLRKNETLVVTQNGKPTAYVIRADPARVDRDLDEIRRMRFDRATDTIRAAAKAKGLHKWTMKEVDAEIAKARKERRLRRSA